MDTDNLNTSFDSERTRARFNYLIDALRGCYEENDGYVPFDEMSQINQKIYTDEATKDSYVIGTHDINIIEDRLKGKKV